MRKGHWTDAVKAENETLKRQLTELRQQPMLEGFSRAVAENIMIQLSLTPYEAWPDVAKRAFDHEARRTPTLSYIWKARLPQG